jgi:antitoxin VapB
MKTNTLKATTRTFKSGNSIAVRIPHEFNLEAGKTFEIKRRGRELVLVEQEETLAGLIDILQSLPADFFAEGRDDPPPEPVMSFDDEAPPVLLKRTAAGTKKTKKASTRQAK